MEKNNFVILGSWMLVKVGPDSAGNYSCSTHTSNTAIVTINVVDGQFEENFKFCVLKITISGERIPEAMLEEELKSYSSSVTNCLSAVTFPLPIALFITSRMILLLKP